MAIEDHFATEDIMYSKMAFEEEPDWEDLHRDVKCNKCDWDGTKEELVRDWALSGQLNCPNCEESDWDYLEEI